MLVAATQDIDDTILQWMLVPQDPKKRSQARS
eukprot:SAG11_NODE_1976_length_3974_cov_4.102452_6_plen_31_part_01